MDGAKIYLYNFNKFLNDMFNKLLVRYGLAKLTNKGRRMDNNSIGIFNNIVYQIYNIDDFEAMKIEVLNSIRLLIPFKCASILMGSERREGNLLADPISVPKKYTEMEEDYLRFEERDFSSWILRQSHSVVFRVTDFMDDSDRIETEVYKNCFKPYGLHYSLDLTISTKGQLLGDLSLYRAEDEKDFSDEEIWYLRLLSDHLNSRFYVNKYGYLKIQKLGIGKIGNLIGRYGLTKREAEILQYVLEGKTNEQISEDLYISGNTLKKHLHNLYTKTGAVSRVQLLSLDND